MEKQYAKIIIDSLVTVIENSRRYKADQKIYGKRLPASSKSFVDEAMPYLFLCTKLVYKTSMHPFDLDVEFAVETDAQNHFKITGEGCNAYVNTNRLTRYQALLMQSKPDFALEPAEKYKFFILLVNLLAFYEIEGSSPNRMHGCLTRLMLVLFGDYWLNAEVVGVESVLHDVVKEYRTIFENFFSSQGLERHGEDFLEPVRDSDAKRIINFIYGFGNSQNESDIEKDENIERILFNSYSTLLGANRVRYNFTAWLLGRSDEEDDYIDATPLVKNLLSGVEGSSDVRLAIHHRDSKSLSVERESYYAMLIFVAVVGNDNPPPSTHEQSDAFLKANPGPKRRATV